MLCNAGWSGWWLSGSPSPSQFYRGNNHILQCQSVSQSAQFSSWLGSLSVCLVNTRPVNDRFIRVRGQVRSSGRETCDSGRPTGRGYDLSLLSSLVSPDYNVWNIVQAVVRQLLGLTTTTYTPLIGLYGLFAAFRNISGETGTAVTIQLWSLSWSHTAQYH